MKYAFDLEKPLLPVRLSDKVQSKFLPHDLGERQVVDYIRQDRNEGWRLRRSISDLPKAPRLPDPLPEPPTVPGSYRPLMERIETESRLQENVQFALVTKLRCRLRDGSRAEETNELLQLLPKRHELLHDVVCEIYELQGDGNRGQRGSLSNKVRAVSNDKLEDHREDHVPEAGPESSTERQLKLDCSSAIAECRGLMERVLNKGECWVFEIDPDNNFVIELDASAAAPCIMAKASLLDHHAKAKELKALGWTIDSFHGIKVVLAGVAVGLTLGLALLSRGVRKFLVELEARRSWIVTSPKDSLLGAAAEFTLALRRVAPEV